MEFSDAVKSLRLHWRFSVAIMLIAGGALAAFLVTRDRVRAANQYRASVDVLIPATDSKGVRPAGVPPALLQGQTTMAGNPAIKKRALENAHLSTKLAVRFGSAISAGHDVVTLSATSRSRKTASAAAAGYVAAFGQARAQAVANSAQAAQSGAIAEVSALDATLAKTNAAIVAADPSLLSTLAREPTSTTSPTAALPAGTPSSVQTLIVERNALLQKIQSLRQAAGQNLINSVIPSGYATTLQVYSPVQVTPPPPAPYIPIAAFLGAGLLLALAVPILRDRLDRSIRTPKAAAAALDATVLTSIPPVSRRLQHVLAPPGSAPEVAYRALAATSIATDRLPEAIVVTSPKGTTQDSVAANFAAALAGLGLRVALVATDPRQSWFLDGSAGDEELSFRELLQLAHQGRLNGSLPRGLIETHVPNLLVLPPGKPNGKVELDGLRPLLEALSASDVHVTVIAGPALLDDPDATIFAWTTRSVLWAIQPGEVTESEAKEAASRLALAGVETFGIAMVNVKT